MKITKRQLRRIIKEELSRALKEQGASDEVRARLGMPSGDRNPWQPTSTRWTGMPSRGGGNEEDPRGDLRAELQAALDGMGREVTREDVLQAADRAAEVSRGADEAIYKALAVLFHSKKRMG